MIVSSTINYPQCVMCPCFYRGDVQSVLFLFCAYVRQGGMMNLNLQILQADLRDSVLAANIIDNRLKRRLAFAVLCPPPPPGYWETVSIYAAPRICRMPLTWGSGPRFYA
jgi:hypothetical protein